MTFRAAELIRRRLGWCPNTRAFSPAQVQEHKNPGLPVRAVPGSGGSPAGSGSGRYRHTQTGTVQIVATIIAAVIIIISQLVMGWFWLSSVILVFLLACLLLFAFLTVSVTAEVVEIRFGIGLVKRSIPLGSIVSAETVKTPWYYGWGIRWTPEGPLYNVAGEGGVRIVLDSGKTLRIGTDEPELLAEAIRKAAFLPQGRC